MLAIAVLLLNDHVLKELWPHPWVTGKLSDVAGLVFFPLFLQAAVEWVLSLSGRSWGPSRRVLAVAVVATGVVFALVQLTTTGDAIYRWGLGLLQAPFRGSWVPVRHVADAADLVACPALWLPWWTGRRRGSPSSQ